MILLWAEKGVLAHGNNFAKDHMLTSDNSFAKEPMLTCDNSFAEEHMFTCVSLDGGNGQESRQAGWSLVENEEEISLRRGNFC